MNNRTPTIQIQLWKIKMLKKTVSMTLKTMLVAPISVAMLIGSAQVSAENKGGHGHYGHGMKYLCLYLPTIPDDQRTPGFSFSADPKGSYIAVKMEKKHALRFDDASLKSAKGLAIGRVPDLTNGKGFGDWVSTPLTGTCIQHGDEIQCGFGTISSVTTPFPAPIGSVTSSIQVGSGHLSLLYDMDNQSTMISQIGAIDVFYYDKDGKAVDKTPLPKFKRIKGIITNAEKISCDDLPHAEIAPFYIDMK